MINKYCKFISDDDEQHNDESMDGWLVGCLLDWYATTFNTITIECIRLVINNLMRQCCIKLTNKQQQKQVACMCVCNFVASVNTHLKYGSNEMYATGR